MKGNHSYLYMFFATVCLALTGIFVKLIGNDINSIALNFYRFFFGFLFLLVFVPFFDRDVFKVTFKDLKDNFMIGSFLLIGSLFYLAAFTFAPVQNVVLIYSVESIFVMIFSYFILKEKITSIEVFVLSFAVVGLALINPFKSGPYFIGNIFALLSALFAGLQITYMRKENQDHNVGVVVWQLMPSVVVLFPLLFVFGIGDIKAIFSWALLLGIICGGLAYFLYNLALENLEAEIASLMGVIFVPLLSISMAVLFLGEVLNVKILIGGSFLLMSGIILETNEYLVVFLSKIKNLFSKSYATDVKKSDEVPSAQLYMQNIENSPVNTKLSYNDFPSPNSFVSDLFMIPIKSINVAQPEQAMALQSYDIINDTKKFVRSKNKNFLILASKDTWNNYSFSKHLTKKMVGMSPEKKDQKMIDKIIKDNAKGKRFLKNKRLLMDLILRYSSNTDGIILRTSELPHFTQTNFTTPQTKIYDK